MEFGKRKLFAVTKFLEIFDKYILKDDRVAFIRFNTNVNVVFPLQEKGKNEIYLRKNL